MLNYQRANLKFHKLPVLVQREPKVSLFGSFQAQSDDVWWTSFALLESLWLPLGALKNGACNMAGNPEMLFFYPGWWLSHVEPIPLKNDGVRQMGWLFHSQYIMENEKCLKPPTSFYLFLTFPAEKKITSNLSCRVAVWQRQQQGHALGCSEVTRIHPYPLYNFPLKTTLLVD